MTRKLSMGKAVYAALPGVLVLLALLSAGCNKAGDDSAAANGTIAPKATTVIPADAPPAAQQAIRSSQAQGAAIQQRANAEAAARKAAQGK